MDKNFAFFILFRMYYYLTQPIIFQCNKTNPAKDVNKEERKVTDNKADRLKNDSELQQYSYF